MEKPITTLVDLEKLVAENISAMDSDMIQNGFMTTLKDVLIPGIKGACEDALLRQKSDKHVIDETDRYEIGMISLITMCIFAKYLSPEGRSVLDLVVQEMYSKYADHIQNQGEADMPEVPKHTTVH